MAITKPKDPAAVALGRKGGKARLKMMTPAQRTAAARKAVLVRWHGKPKVSRWWVLIKFDGGDPSHPQIADSDVDRQKLLERVRARPDYFDGGGIVDYIEYDPSRFTIERQYRPDTGAQMKALGVLMDSEGGGE